MYKSDYFGINMDWNSFTLLATFISLPVSIMSLKNIAQKEACNRTTRIIINQLILILMIIIQQ